VLTQWTISFKFVLVHLFVMERSDPCQPWVATRVVNRYFASAG
jgi:hypothetical protein